MCLEDGDFEGAWPTSTYSTQRFLRPGSRLSMVQTAGASASVPVPDGVLVVEDFPVTYEGYTYPHGKIAYIAGAEPKPVVMIHPNYAGAKQYASKHPISISSLSLTANADTCIDTLWLTREILQIRHGPGMFLGTLRVRCRCCGPLQRNGLGGVWR